MFFCILFNIFILLDTEEQATEYLNGRRRVLPAIYNHNLQKYNWNAPEPDDATCNATVHVKLEFEVERLTNEVRRLQNQMAVEDLDHDELEDIQRIMLDSDDEDAVELLIPAPIKIKTEPIDDENDLNLHFDGSSYDENANPHEHEEQATNVGSTLIQPSQSNEPNAAENNISTVAHTPKSVTNNGHGSGDSFNSAIAGRSSQSQSVQLNENIVSSVAHTPDTATANSHGNNVSFGLANTGPSSQSVRDPVAGNIPMVIDVS